MLSKIVIRLDKMKDAEDRDILLAEVEGLCEDYGAECISDE